MKSVGPRGGVCFLNPIRLFRRFRRNDHRSRRRRRLTSIKRESRRARAGRSYGETVTRRRGENCGDARTGGGGTVGNRFFWPAFRLGNSSTTMSRAPGRHHSGALSPPLAYPPMPIGRRRRHARTHASRTVLLLKTNNIITVIVSLLLCKWTRNECRPCPGLRTRTGTVLEVSHGYRRLRPIVGGRTRVFPPSRSRRPPRDVSAVFRKISYAYTAKR